MVSEKLGAAFVEVGADLSPLEKSLGSIPGMMQHAGTNITGGLKSSLQGGNFSDVGKQLGNQLVTGMTSQFGMLGQAAGTFATALGPAGIALLGIGASVAVIGVGLGKCVSSAATWQDLMVDVQKVTNTTEAGFSKLSSDLLAIRGSTGASMEDIAGAAAGAGRMGIAPEEIADYTETILKMSSAWGMSADAASESIGKIGSVVKPAEMSWTEFGNRMGSTINDLADSMATSEESIVTGMKKVSAQMAMLKPDPSQLSAWAALVGQLQAFGMTAETSGESLKDSLNYMMRDDKGGISSMLDMDATEFQEAIREDAIGTVQELAVAISELPIEEQGQALQKFGATGGQMMGMLVGKVDPVTKEIEGLNAALETGASAWENASSLNEAYAKSQETLHAQIDIFKGKISVVATSIGSVLLPHLTQMMTDINGITQALMDLGAKGWKWLYGGVDEKGVGTKGAIGRFTGWMDEILGIEYGARAGEDIGKNVGVGIGKGISGTGKVVTKELESADGKGAGEKVGKSFTDAFNEYVGRGISKELAGPMAAFGFSDIEALNWINSQSSGGSGRQWGETFEAGGSTIGVGYEKGGQLPWFLQIGDWRKSFDSPDAARAYVAEHFLALDDLISPEQWEIAWKSARQKTTGSYDDPGDVVRLKAKLELDSDLEAEAERLQAEFESAYSEALEKPFAVGGLGDKMADLLGDVAEDGWAAFEDGLITASEASDIETQLADLKLADPEAFEEAGGQAALSWWGRLVGMLEQRSYNIANNIDTTGINEEIQKHIDAGEPYIAEVTAKVSPEASALREALFWEEYDGSKTKKGLGEFADDLYSLSQSLSDLGSDAEAAYRIITNPWDYEKSTVSLAKDFLLSVIPKEIDPEAIDAIAKYFTKAGKAGLEKASAETTTSIMPGWWSGFGAWQEAQEDMFARSYIGPTEGWAGPGQGAKEGYEAQNYFQYAVEVDLELDPAAANTELEKLEGDIKTEKIAPVLADISPAMTELDRLEAEIMAPTTKPIWLEVMNPGVLDTWGPSGGNYAGGTLAPSGWLSFAPGGIISSPVRAVVGDARTPEVVAPLGDLLPMIQQAVATAGGGGGVTVNAPITVYGGGDAREIAREVAEELKIEISDAYVGRLRGGH